MEKSAVGSNGFHCWQPTIEFDKKMHLQSYFGWGDIRFGGIFLLSEWLLGQVAYTGTRMLYR